MRVVPSIAFTNLRLRSSASGEFAGVAGGVAAAAVCAVAVVAVASAPPPSDRTGHALLEGLIVGLPVGAGVYATRSPPTGRFGFALLAAGLVWSLTALAESTESLPYSIGRVCAWLVFPILFYLVLAFPHGRLAGVDRRLLGTGTLIVALLFVGSALFVEDYPQHTPWAHCTADCPPNAFLVLDEEPGVMSRLVAPARELLAIALFFAIASRQIARWRALPPLRARVLAPLMTMSVFSAVTISIYFVVRRVDQDSAALGTLGTIWTLSIPGVAAAFLLGLVHRRTVVGEVLTRLSIALSRRLDRRQLRATLASALDDPTVEVLVPDEVPGRWRDTGGRETSRSKALAAGRAVTTIEHEGAPVAALVHDAALSDDEELLAPIRALALATVQHERVTSRLAASLEELDVSRKRIARAADLERSRIERDLHDGAQQRLIGLRIKLSLVEELAARDPVAGANAVRELGSEVDLALEDLRSLAHGIYPSLLSDRGLVDALRTIASELALPVHFGTRGVTRQPAEVETAVYFSCVEAMQNAIKHARGATALWLTLRQTDLLRFELRDDGAGFTPPGGDFNGGLRNMRDRVEAVGGQLTIDAAPGHGTRIRGMIPLF
jgi:signal transduction histidine kinase